MASHLSLHTSHLDASVGEKRERERGREEGREGGRGQSVCESRREAIHLPAFAPCLSSAEDASRMGGALGMHITGIDYHIFSSPACILEAHTILLALICQFSVQPLLRR